MRKTAFSNVPWAVEHLGNLYCRDGVLYVCFADQDSIRIPGNVHTIAVFAFMNIHAAELILPDSIRCIEDNAFIGASFGKIVMPPDRATFTAGTYKGSLLESVGYEEGAYMKGKKIKVPDLYELAFIKTGYKGYNNSESKIHKIEIREAPAGVTEEWFWSANTSGFGGGIETNLLEQWLKDHPEISVLSKDESREKQKYRWFVSI